MSELNLNQTVDDVICGKTGFLTTLTFVICHKLKLRSYYVLQGHSQTNPINPISTVLLKQTKPAPFTPPPPILKLDVLCFAPCRSKINLSANMFHQQ